MAELQKLLSEKDETIRDLNARLTENADPQPNVMKMNNDDAFVSKPRKGAKGESNACEISGCSNTNVDLIKCSMCGNLVCEDCTGVKVAKLRPVMNACSTLYFTCTNCDVLIRDTSDVNVYDSLKCKIDNLTEELESYKKENTELSRQVKHPSEEEKQLREKVVDLEKEVSGQEMKIKMQGGIIQHMKSKGKEDSDMGHEKRHQEVDIDAKLEAFSVGILSKVTEIMEKKISGVKVGSISPSDPADSAESVAPNTWSNVVSQSRSMKSVMRDARNDEKIEESEKQRRANNIIIHGAEEIGDTPDEIKEGDAGYIKEIFAKIGVEAAPVTIARLGASKENGKQRPIKLVMKSIEEKDVVMSNLGRLKGTERYFGRISVKDDYTTNERDQIRMLTDEAKKKGEENPDRAFKVRGNSKKGWRIVSFLKK